MNKSRYIIKDISKTYDINGEEHIVLKNLSLEINTEDITVILGKSGCGKTTLLRIIGNLESASSGNVSFIKNEKETRPKVGIVFQESRLMPWLDVSENIAFNGDEKNGILHKIKRRFKLEDNNESRENIERYLRLMKLEKFRNSYPYELSGGMAQRVSIARALYFDPDILLMDEPFSALDYFTRLDMQNEIIKIHNYTNKGIIFVTHDINEAMRIADKIIVFTKDYEIKEFKMDKDMKKDIGNELYIRMEKEILNTLNYT